MAAMLKQIRPGRLRIDPRLAHHDWLAALSSAARIMHALPPPSCKKMLQLF
jgi:hypothetical protein